MIHGLFIAGATQHASRTNKAQTTGQEASRTANRVRNEQQSMKMDIEKLFMITEAFWEVLKHQHGYTDDQLIEMVQEIDLRDGKLDGKVAKSEERPTCTNCGRVLIRQQVKYLYCGTVAQRHPFDR